MNFVLKATDVFETSTKSGEYFLRIVDAKFALPKQNDDLTREFVCLDMPEYPGEHDDITIGFHNEHGKYRLLLLFVILILTDGRTRETYKPTSCRDQ